MSLITQDVVNGKILETGTLSPEITATSILHREGLHRTADQTPVGKIFLRQVYPGNGFLNKDRFVLMLIFFRMTHNR